MIASAGDHNFSGFAGIFLRSLFKNGGVRPADVTYFIFDLANEEKAYKRNCYRMLRSLLRVERAINARVIGFNEMRAMMREIRRFGTAHWIPDGLDFLKAYIFRYIKAPYLWLDSDMIVQKPIDGFFAACLKKKRLAMVASKSDTADMGHYFSYYLKCRGKRLAGSLRRRGVLNGGLIFIPEDYTGRWFDVYRTVAAPDSGAFTGQGVWNALVWLDEGSILPGKYNFKYQGAGNDRVSIMHFVRGGKYEMKEYASERHI